MYIDDAAFIELASIAYPLLRDPLNNIAKYIHEMQESLQNARNENIGTKERCQEVIADSDAVKIVESLLKELGLNGALSKDECVPSTRIYRKIAVIKAIRATLHLGLKESKDIAERALES